MIKIGGGWCKKSQKDNEYISISIAKELLALGFELTDKTFLSLHLNTNKERDEHPDYNLCLSLAEEEKK